MRRFIAAGAMVASLLLASSAQAFELLQPDGAGNARIEAGQSVDDTLLVAGQSVDIRGPISKDLFAIGSSVSVDSTVGGNIVAGGGAVTVKSTVSDDLIVGGGTVKVDKDALIAGDVMVFGGTVEILGTVTGKVQAFAGSVSVSGTVGGDVTVQADTVLLGEAAQIGGSLAGTVGTPLAEGAANHVKGTTDVSVEDSSGKSFSALGAAAGLGVAAGLLSVLYSVLSLLVTGLALILLAPKLLDRLRARSHSQPLNSGLLGLGLLVGTPVVFILCLVFFITIPLGLLELALFGLIALLGSVAASLWVGELVGSHQWSPLLTLAVGAIILALVGLIPIVGMLLKFVAWLVGLGSVGFVLYRQLTEQKGT